MKAYFNWCYIYMNQSLLSTEVLQIFQNINKNTNSDMAERTCHHFDKEMNDIRLFLSGT